MFLISLFIASSIIGMCQASDTSWNILIIVHSSWASLGTVLLIMMDPFSLKSFVDWRNHSFATKYTLQELYWCLIHLSESRWGGKQFLPKLPMALPKMWTPFRKWASQRQAGNIGTQWSQVLSQVSIFIHVLKSYLLKVYCARHCSKSWG